MPEVLQAPELSPKNGAASRRMRRGEKNDFSPNKPSREVVSSGFPLLRRSHHTLAAPLPRELFARQIESEKSFFLSQRAFSRCKCREDVAEVTRKRGSSDISANQWRRQRAVCRATRRQTKRRRAGGRCCTAGRRASATSIASIGRCGQSCKYFLRR